MGLEGILLGNVIAYFVTNFWFETFALFKWYFKENPIKVFLQFAYTIAITSIASIGMYFLCKYIYTFGKPYFVISAAASLVVSSLAVLALYPIRGFKELIQRAKRVFSSIVEKTKFIYEKNKIQKCVLIGYLVTMTLTLILRDFLAINIHKFVFLGVFVLFVLLSNKKNALYIILFTLPFGSSLAELYILLFALAYLCAIAYKDHSARDWIVIFSVPSLILKKYMFSW